MIEGRAGNGAPLFRGVQDPVSIGRIYQTASCDSKGRRSMRGVWIIAILALAAPATAREWHPQHTAISTPTSEALDLERRRARPGIFDGILVGGAAGAMALGWRPASSRPKREETRLIRPGAYKDFVRTDDSVVPLTPHRPSLPATAYRPAPPAPLEVKLSAH
jgi:hypothetical protein